VKEIEVPYVTMLNEFELTDPDLLDRRYRPALDRLWEEYSRG